MIAPKLDAAVEDVIDKSKLGVFSTGMDGMWAAVYGKDFKDQRRCKVVAEYKAAMAYLRDLVIPRLQHYLRLTGAIVLACDEDRAREVLPFVYRLIASQIRAYERSSGRIGWAAQLEYYFKPAHSERLAFGLLSDLQAAGTRPTSPVARAIVKALQMGVEAPLFSTKDIRAAPEVSSALGLQPLSFSAASSSSSRTDSSLQKFCQYKDATAVEAMVAGHQGSKDIWADPRLAPMSQAATLVGQMVRTFEGANNSCVASKALQSPAVKTKVRPAGSPLSGPAAPSAAVGSLSMLPAIIEDPFEYMAAGTGPLPEGAETLVALCAGMQGCCLKGTGHDVTQPLMDPTNVLATSGTAAGSSASGAAGMETDAAVAGHAWDGAGPSAMDVADGGEPDGSGQPNNVPSSGAPLPPPPELAAHPSLLLGAPRASIYRSPLKGPAAVEALGAMAASPLRARLHAAASNSPLFRSPLGVRAGAVKK